MDRLPALMGRALLFALLSGLLVVVGCDDSKPSGPPPSRFEAVHVNPKDRPTAAGFCDVHPAAAEAPTFSFPALADDVAPPSAVGWQWLTIWATWCHPCVEELPRLVDFRRRLAAEHHPIALELLSVDGSNDAIATFRKAHTGTPSSMRIKDPHDLPAWLGHYGLDEGATIPIQIFIDPQKHVRCVRTGSVSEDDYAAVEDVMDVH